MVFYTVPGSVVVVVVSTFVDGCVYQAEGIACNTF